MIYVVLSPGRTGSNLVVNLIKEYYHYQGIHYSVYRGREYTSASKDENIIFHSHKRQFLEVLNLDPSWVTLIVSSREPMFDSIMSMALANLFEEFVNYTPRDTTLILSLDNFHRVMMHYLIWYEQLDLTPSFNNVINITYDDATNVTRFTEKMNFESIDYSQVPYNKSLYSYKDIIGNWKYLKDQFDEYYIWYQQHGVFEMTKRFNIII